jgi:integrase
MRHRQVLELDANPCSDSQQIVTVRRARDRVGGRARARVSTRPIRPHDLRHTTATLLKTLGVKPRDAMDILGHSRIAVTLWLYTAGDEQSRREAIGNPRGVLP